MPQWSAELPLVGAGGEPVDLWRTISSHGLVSLSPARIDEEARVLEITVPVEGRPPRTLRISSADARRARVEVLGPRPTKADQSGVLRQAAHLLRLDEDLSAFYAAVASDPDLSWAGLGAGRIARSATAFEDVVKTICTTNCTWAATQRMVGALVEHLGEPAAGAPPDGPYGRAFPTAAAMVAADETFYRDVARAGYRGAYLRSLAASVAGGELDLEALAQATPNELPDEELERALLAVPGVGPYAAAHIMMMLGRYSRLILDSWTRPKYARLNGGRPAKDHTIARRFRRYGPYAGLAFWLVLTRDWVED